LSKKVTVDNLLSEIKYSFDSYVPSKEAVAFVNFVKLIGVEDNKTPVVHFKMLDNIFSKYKMHAIMCHRGMAKSTLLGEYLHFWIAVFNNIPNFGFVNFSLYVADSAEGGAKTLRKNMEFKYNHSEFLQQQLPKVKFTDGELWFQNKSGGETIIRLFGGQQNIRGQRALGKRPQLAIMDDLLSDQDAKSDTVLENIENNINKAISKALDPTHQKQILIGTPFHEGDPLYRRIQNSQWNASVYPICEKFPCKKSEFKGSWEERFSYDYVRGMYLEAKENGSLDGFYQELMLQVKSDDQRLVLDDDIKFIEPAKKYNTYYITTDFATSEKQAADFSVISVWGITAKGHKVLIDGRAERCLMDKNMDDLFWFCKKYNPLQVGIEVTGQQGGFIQWVKNQMVEKNIFFNLKEIRPNIRKMERFQRILPEFKMGLLYFSNKLEELFKDEIESELKGATVKKFTSRHDDFIDTISMLYELDGIYAGFSGDVNKDEFNNQDYLKLDYKKQEKITDIFSEIEYNTSKANDSFYV